jgi:hypothetical protein
LFSIPLNFVGGGQQQYKPAMLVPTPHPDESLQ